VFYSQGMGKGGGSNYIGNLHCYKAINQGVGAREGGWVRETEGSRPDRQKKPTRPGRRRASLAHARKRLRRWRNRGFLGSMAMLPKGVNSKGKKKRSQTGYFPRASRSWKRRECSAESAK